MPSRAAQPSTQTSRTLPQLALERLSGSGDLQATISGRVTVIDLWASWCEACVETTARVERLADAYADSDLLVIAINVGEDRAQVEQHLGGPPKLPTFLDVNFRFSDALGVREVPLVLVVDRKGRIVHMGTTVDHPMLDTVRRMLKTG